MLSSAHVFERVHEFERRLCVYFKFIQMKPGIAIQAKATRFRDLHLIDTLMFT